MVRSNLAGRSSLVKFTRHNGLYVRARRDHVGASSSDVTKKRPKKRRVKGVNHQTYLRRGNLHLRARNKQC